VTQIEQARNVLIHGAAVDVLSCVQLLEQVVEVDFRQVCLMNLLQFLPHSFRGHDGVLFQEQQLQILTHALDISHGCLVPQHPLKPVLFCCLYLCVLGSSLPPGDIPCHQ
jgi:hypothetical protein